MLCLAARRAKRAASTLNVALDYFSPFSVGFEIFQKERVSDFSSLLKRSYDQPNDNSSLKGSAVSTKDSFIAVRMID